VNVHPEQQYLDLLRRLIEDGDERIDRTGVGTRAIFGYEMRFDLQDGFPVFTTKKVFWKTAFKEMLWMLSGGSNIRELVQQGVHIWTDWPLRFQRRSQCSDHSRRKQGTGRWVLVRDLSYHRRWGTSVQ